MEYVKNKASLRVLTESPLVSWEADITELSDEAKG